MSDRYAGRIVEVQNMSNKQWKEYKKNLLIKAQSHHSKEKRNQFAHKLKIMKQARKELKDKAERKRDKEERKKEIERRKQRENRLPQRLLQAYSGSTTEMVINAATAAGKAIYNVYSNASRKRKEKMKDKVRPVANRYNMTDYLRDTNHMRSYRARTSDIG